MKTNPLFYRSMMSMFAISIIAWAVFLVFYRVFWPGSITAGDGLTLYWIWFGIGATAFCAFTYFVFRWLQIPREWHAAAAIAFSAPALLLDMFATLYFELWNTGADVRFYPAMILGGTGVLLFAILYSSAPQTEE